MLSKNFFYNIIYIIISQFGIQYFVTSKDRDLVQKNKTFVSKFFSNILRKAILNRTCRIPGNNGIRLYIMGDHRGSRNDCSSTYSNARKNSCAETYPYVVINDDRPLGMSLGLFIKHHDLERIC